MRPRRAGRAGGPFTSPLRACEQRRIFRSSENHVSSALDRRGPYVRKPRSPRAAQRRRCVRSRDESARRGVRRPARWPAVRSAGPIHLRPFQDAGARARPRTLCSSVPSRARSAAENQLRGVGKNPLPGRLRAVRQWTGPVSGDLFPSRSVFPEGGEDARRRRRRVTPDHLRPVLFRDASEFTGARSAEGRRLRRAAGPGGAGRRTRLAQERLGRFPRRRLFPLDRRARTIRPVFSRRRA